MTNKPIVACAIYTRKSSEEGLEQAFNSLDAQYEACASYIQSQKHEGWKLSKGRYDDGGISGATLDCPGLERLLQDMECGLIKMIVVYKIDRLTRSLADFARLVERMDKAGCSFVSVTQAFNTSNSMGRLTLNVLLSFAQFEREVTAERIRDKIAASKAKGMWMGGYPPLGYDRDPDPNIQSIVIDPEEAEQVKVLYGLFETHGRLIDVEREAARLGIRSKHHVFANGRTRGGSVMSRGQVHAILSNPVYAGMIRHKDKVFEGLHDAIIDKTRWSNIQAGLMLNASKPRKRATLADTYPTPSLERVDRKAPLLRGLLFDEAGNRLTPTWSKKGDRQYRYYTSSSARKCHSPIRLPAKPLEEMVANAIISHFQNRDWVGRCLNATDTQIIEASIKAAADLATQLKNNGDVRELVKAVSLEDNSLCIILDKEALAAGLNMSVSNLINERIVILVPFTRRRRGNETRIVIKGASILPDPVLIRILALSHRWLGMLKAGKSLDEIAKKEGYSTTYIRTRMPMALLSPKIQTVILNGKQPPELTADTLARKTLSISWHDQEIELGFGPS